MKRIQKIILGAMGVALLSASVSTGVYSLMERRSARRMASTEIDGDRWRCFPECRYGLRYDP